MHGTVPTPDGGLAFEMCGDSAAPRKEGAGPETTKRPPPPQQQPQGDVDAASVQANPWPFYLEESTTAAAQKAEHKDGKTQDEAAEGAAKREPANPWPYHGPSGEGR
ncbi:hypothetical protein ACCO45_010349 [Purpureocillium lilacinum]|uniref:Uncharacterized protein n=1 Tax=Purpureocillium lilacinum TaxID=33203 RepID=A0ACC4DEV2_PURLI